MAAQSKVRVAVNGYGVIGKRVAHAITLQDDMTLTGVVDVVNDWRARVATQRGMPLFAANAAVADAMRNEGLKVHGTLEDVLGDVDIVIDCTPKRIAAGNAETYRQRKVKYIVQGGEKHSATGHSFAAESNYASALGRNATRVVSEPRSGSQTQALRRDRAAASGALCWSGRHKGEVPCSSGRDSATT